MSSTPSLQFKTVSIVLSYENVQEIKKARRGNFIQAVYLRWYVEGLEGPHGMNLTLRALGEAMEAYLGVRLGVQIMPRE